MDEIKREYLNPVLLLYTYRGCIEESLVSRDISTARNIVLTESMNEVSTLTFEIPFTEDRKISYDDCEKLVKYENEYYIIKNIEVEDSDTRTIQVSCEHESTELKGKYCECINEIGQSPEHMFNTIMSSIKTVIKEGQYKWAGTDVPSTTFRHLITEDETSVYENFVAMAKVFNGWIEIYTDDYDQKWVYLRTKDLESNRIFRKDLDMKSLGITYDSTEIFTHLYLEGGADEVTGNPITIMSVNPTGKSYLENYSWYLAKGIPFDVVDSEPKYQQLKKLSDDNYINPQDLYQLGLEELAKCSVPKLDATLTIRDLEAYINSVDDKLKVGMKIICVDKDIDFVFECRIVKVERDSENPIETKIEISNVIRYDTDFQNIDHTADIVDKVTSTSPWDTDGNATGDGTPYIPMNCVCDGDHWNVVHRFQELQAMTTLTYNNIKLRVEELNKSYAELSLTANSITSTVEEYGKAISKIEQKADSIVSTVTSLDNNMEVARSSIEQYADNIKIKVSKGDVGSMIEQFPDSVKISWNHVSRYAELDDEVGLKLIDPEKGTWSQVGYDGRLSLMMSKSQQYPYHALMCRGSLPISCTEEDDYTESYDDLDPMFEGIDDDNIAVACSIQKLSNGGSVSPFWFGAYATIEDGRVKISAISYWYELEHTDNGATISEGDLVNGDIIVSWVAIA